MLKMQLKIVIQSSLPFFETIFLSMFSANGINTWLECASRMFVHYFALL